MASPTTSSMVSSASSSRDTGNGLSGGLLGLSEFSQTLTDALRTKFGAAEDGQSRSSSTGSRDFQEVDSEYTSGSSLQSVKSSLTSVPFNGGCSGPCIGEGRTTLMLKNVPVRYTQRKLLRELLGNGFQGKLDFIYLPMDPRSRSSRGFCFCNFCTPADAEEFNRTFHRKHLKSYQAEVPLEVCPAEVQGFEANASHYFEVRASRKEKGRDTFGCPIFLKPLPSELLTQYRCIEQARFGSERFNRDQENLHAGTGTVTLYQCTTCWKMKQVTDFCPHCEQNPPAVPAPQASAPPSLGPSFWI